MSRKKRAEKLPAFTPMLHHVMDCAAFVALSPLAQCLYLRLKRRAGVGGRRQGEVFYAVREAAEDLNANKDTVSRAFHQLQAHGFIVAVQIGSLGISGEGKATTWRLTEYPATIGTAATKDFLRWAPGRDFPIQKGKGGNRKKQKPVRIFRTACPVSSDVLADDDPKTAPPCPVSSDVSSTFQGEPVRRIRTPKDLPSGVGKSSALRKAASNA